jgi:phage terminase large subunit
MGITFCKSLKLHSKDTNENLNAEGSTYQWDQNKYGHLIERPFKYNDHLMDAMRYALFSHLRVRMDKQGLLIHDYGAIHDGVLDDLDGF